jgi:hypothetical protein
MMFSATKRARRALKELVIFDRTFEIWAYQVSPHQPLLLRSSPNGTCPTRIEIFFKQVDTINLPTRFHGLSISEATDEDVQSVGFEPERLLRNHQKLFVLRGSEYSGYVVAGMVTWHESDLRDDDESYFTSMMEIPALPFYTRFFLLLKIKLTMFFRNLK